MTTRRQPNLISIPSPRLASGVALVLAATMTSVPVLCSVQQSSPSRDAASRASAALEQLRSDINSIIAHPAFARAGWGVKVASLATGKILFEHNPQKYFTPASNAKLFSAALALNNLGPDYRIETSLYAGCSPNASGTLDSDLIVYGRGDPDFRAGLHSGDYQAALEPLAAALVKA